MRLSEEIVGNEMVQQQKLVSRQTMMRRRGPGRKTREELATANITKEEKIIAITSAYKTRTQR